MRERCPGCRRSVTATDAQCPRCGAPLSGIELEGAELAFAGDELVLGRAAPGARGASADGRAAVDAGGLRGVLRGRRRTLVAVVLVVAVVAGLRFLGGSSGSSGTAEETSTSTTVAGDATTTTATAAPTTTAAPGATAQDPATSTTSTTVDRREVRSPDGLWTASVVHKPESASLVASGASSERLGLTMVDAQNSGNGAIVRFTDMDSGKAVEVNLSVPEGGLYSQPTLFPGAAVASLQVGAPDRGTPRFAAATILADGEIRTIDGVGRMLATLPYRTAGTSFERSTWFVAADDERRLLLVDVISGETLRTIEIPPASTAFGVMNGSPLLSAPSGRSYTIGDDGTLRSIDIEAPRTSAGTRGAETVCDAALTECHKEYIDETGRRTPIATGTGDPTNAAVAPGGAHLVALVPSFDCTTFCDPGAGPSSDRPLQIFNADTGQTAVVAMTSARSVTYSGSFGESALVQWSSNGQWLFFPTSGESSSLSAWRPGLMTPLRVAVPFTVDQQQGFGNGLPMLAYPTPPPAG